MASITIRNLDDDEKTRLRVRAAMRNPPDAGRMHVIDTNVVSELMRHSSSPAVAAWIAGRDAEELYLTAVSEAELLYGVAIVPAGRRPNELEAVMLRWLDTGFAERFLLFDSRATRAHADIAAVRRSAGHPIAPVDRQNAALARCRSMAVATRNLRDFGDIDVEFVDPWTAA